MRVSTINTTITLRSVAFQDETLGAVQIRGDFALINWGGCASPIFQNVPEKIVARSTFDVEIVYPYSSLVTKCKKSFFLQFVFEKVIFFYPFLQPKKQ